MPLSGVARELPQERPLQFQHGNVRVKSWQPMSNSWSTSGQPNFARALGWRKPVRNRPSKILHTELLKIISFHFPYMLDFLKVLLDFKYMLNYLILFTFKQFCQIFVTLQKTFSDHTRCIESNVGQLLANSSPTLHPMGSCKGLACNSPLATPKSGDFRIDTTSKKLGDNSDISSQNLSKLVRKILVKSQETFGRFPPRIAKCKKIIGLAPLQKMCRGFLL